MLRTLIISLFFLLFAACNKTESVKDTFPMPQWPVSLEAQAGWDTSLSREVLYDKMLGSLVGSAIGDAMGGPTEMWGRDYIQAQWGYVDTLDVLTREGSAEGPWEDNLPGGGTTDDTRWKYFVGNFMASKPAHRDSTQAKDFAKYLLDAYEAEIVQLKSTESFDPEPFDRQLRQMAWLQEWAGVAKPFMEGDAEKYAYALNRFYGGEMTCAGMLYAPAIGAFYPAMPLKAYKEGYRLGFFDIGYARDITALTSAHVAKAMQPGSKLNDILLVARDIDPNRYFNTRLVGRIAYRILADAKYINHESQKAMEETTKAVKLPKNWKYGEAYYRKVEKAYEMLDEKLQDIPFHAAEIYIINLTAILVAEGDFRKAIEFVVNYGRDNDTVGAVTGAILGAYWGYSKLPKDLVAQTIKTNSEVVGIDLEALAKKMADAAYSGK